MLKLRTTACLNAGNAPPLVRLHGHAQAEFMSEPQPYQSDASVGCTHCRAQNSNRRDRLASLGGLGKFFLYSASVFVYNHSAGGHGVGISFPLPVYSKSAAVGVCAGRRLAAVCKDGLI